MSVYTGTKVNYGNTTSTVWGNSASSGALWYPEQDSANLAQAWTISGNAAGDTLSGGSNNDLMYGLAGADYLYGGSGNDVIFGNAGADYLYGEDGNDWLEYDSADALVDGGSGTDTISANFSSVGASINLTASKYASIEVVQGSSLGDTLFGSSYAESLSGGNGNDLLFGGAGGNDTLFGGSGADTFRFDGGYGNVIIGNDGAMASDAVKFQNVSLSEFNFGGSTNDALAGAMITGATGNLAFSVFKDGVTSSLTVQDWYTSYAASGDRVTRFVTADNVTFNVMLGNSVGSQSFTGTSLADVIYTYTGNNTLNGAAGADTVVGGNGNDLLYYDSLDNLFGGLGNDTVTAASLSSAVYLDLSGSKLKSIEYAIGTSLADTLWGSSLNDTLVGGAGADSLYGGSGNDALIGGAGMDVFLVKPNEGTDTIYADTTPTDNASDVVYLAGSKFSDLSFSTTGNDVVINYTSESGYTGGVDLQNWLTQNTTYGAVDANKYRVSRFVTDDKTFSLAVANDSNTSLWGTSIDDYILGGTGNDTILSYAGSDTIVAGNGDDLIFYDTSDVILDGGNGNDTLSLTKQTVATVIDLGENSNKKYKSIEYVAGSSLADWIAGTSTAAETLSGAAGADVLWGGTGTFADSLAGGTGADTFWFGKQQGQDIIANDGVQSVSDVVYLYDASVADLSFAVGTNNLSVYVGASAGYTDSLTLENWALSNTATASTQNLSRVNTFVTTDMTFSVAIANGATAGATLLGTTGVDIVYGSAYDDSLNGGSGADSINGGDGNDIIVFDSVDYKVDGGSGIDTLKAAGAGAFVYLADSKYTSIEYIAGTTGSDTLGGTSGAETLEGGSGADILWGGSGDDSLSGGAGSDTYWFGSNDGTDTIAADAVNNVSDVVYFGNMNGLVSFSALSFTAGTDDLTISVNEASGYTDKLVLASWMTYNANATTANQSRINKFVTSDGTFGLAVGTDASESLRGTSLADYIQAGAGDDTINGLVGKDLIYAGDGNDIITYSTAALVINGGSGNDTLSVASATAGTMAYLGQTNVTSVEYLLGSSYADSLAGSINDDTIEGGAGNDILWGMTGSDVLTGGAGVDTYWFGSGDGADTISSASTNVQDTVYFYNTGSAFSCTLSGDNLVINYGNGDSLTIADWNKTDGQKLNQFQAAGVSGTYKLTMIDSTTASWTKI